jgi:hypothetical protein
MATQLEHNTGKYMGGKGLTQLKGDVKEVISQDLFT